jgi:3-oxoacyl-[acyl-carrier-protein] synthase II
MSTGIVITRMAARGALGTGLDAIADALARGEVGIRAPDALEQRPAVEAGAGQVPEPGDGVAGSARAEVLLRRTIDDLLDPADRADMAARPARWGMVVGTTLAGMRHCGDGMRADEDGDAVRADRAFARTSASAVLAHALRGLPLTGPTVSVSCACASALAAISHACTLLRAGDVDAVIAGGYDPISEFAYGGFAALQLVATGPLSPFAADREGMKLGEGVALFVLRRAPDAARDGGAVLATVTAAAESSDAHHLTQPHPEGDGAARVLRAVGVADRVPELLVAHATGTPGNDGAEHAAYLGLLGERLPALPVVALKGRFGHPLGAAGALELAAVLACAARGVVPTSAGRGRDRAAFPSLALLEGSAQAGAPGDVVALAAGFGGANAAVRVRWGGGADVAPRVSVPAARTVRLTAVGAVSPAGVGIAALADARAGFAGPMEDAVLAPLLDRARTRRIALLPRLMLAAVRDMANRAALSADDLRETPVVAANWCGAADFTERYYRDLLRSGIDLANPMLFAESVPNIGSAQVSLGFGVRAACISVIGRRTAGLESLALACARIRTGEWTRAIVVGAEEAHPIVERVLARCAGAPVPLASAAVAWLLTADDAGSAGTGACTGMRLHAPVGRTAPLDPAGARAALPAAPGHAWTSASPFARAAVDAGARAVLAAEIGAAGALAVIGCAALDVARGAGTGTEADAAAPAHVVDLDPHGAAWSVAFEPDSAAGIQGLVG